MRMDRRLVLIGVILVVLSMTMATQYASIKATYTFTIVHPSNADIRFISSDNSSSDGERCLRVVNNVTGGQYVTLDLGNWMPDSTVNYSAAFGLVNEQGQYVNLTHVNISGVNASYLDIWVHSNRSVDAPDEPADAAVQIVDNGAALYSASHNVWTLAPGDGDIKTISADYGASGGQTHLPVYWDTGANMWYNDFSANYSVNRTSDFVWVQVCLDIDKDALISGSASTGTIYFHFKASQ